MPYYTGPYEFDDDEHYRGSGYVLPTGVTWNGYSYVARLTVAGKQRYLGSFEDALTAEAAVTLAKDLKAYDDGYHYWFYPNGDTIPVQRDSDNYKTRMAALLKSFEPCITDLDTGLKYYPVGPRRASRPTLDVEALRPIITDLDTGIQYTCNVPRQQPTLRITKEAMEEADKHYRKPDNAVELGGLDEALRPGITDLDPSSGTLLNNGVRIGPHRITNESTEDKIITFEGDSLLTLYLCPGQYWEFTFSYDPADVKVANGSYDPMRVWRTTPEGPSQSWPGRVWHAIRTMFYKITEPPTSRPPYD